MASNTHRTGGALRRASSANRILQVQALIALAALALAAGFGAPAALSASWGAAASLASTAYFARRVFRPVPRGPQVEFAGAMVRAEMVRVALAAVLLAAAFALRDDVVVPALVGAFFVVHVGGGFALLGPDDGGAGVD